MKTIREQVSEIQKEILETDLQPDRAAEMLTQLSALYGNILDEIRTREGEFNQVLFIREPGQVF